MNITLGIAGALLTPVGCSSELRPQPTIEQAVELPVCRAVGDSDCLYAPSDQDVTQLRQAAKACALHEKTLTFERGMLEYAIKIDRSFGEPRNG